MIVDRVKSHTFIKSLKHIPMKILLLILLILFSGIGTGKAQNTSGKFLPTYFIKYGGSSGHIESAAISAKFDLIIAGKSAYNLWPESGLNTWRTIKKYNPGIIIALYQIGPSEYDLNAWGVEGDGWNWIKANHGADAGAERWTGSGHKFDYLANVAYPTERCMYMGNPDWQKYWLNKTYTDFWVTNLQKCDGVNAIFADNTFFKVAWAGNWFEENNTGKAAYKDHPKNYATADGVYDHATWKKDAKAFFNLSVPILASKPVPVKIIPNFGYMGQNPENWIDLDTLGNTPLAAMEEGAFSQPWSGTYGIYNWEVKINTMKNLKNVAALMNNIGKVPEGVGLAKMDILMSGGNYGPSTGWDVLWYSMTSFLLALNESKTNGYFGFSIWGYSNYYWLDEYDAAYLHLGKPLGDYYIPDSGDSKDVAFREYEDGWVVANKALSEAKTNVPVPSGKAYLVTHSNLKNPYSGPLITTFNIGKNRGLILLKEGKKIGNEDNFVPLSIGEKNSGQIKN